MIFQLLHTLFKAILEQLYVTVGNIGPEHLAYTTRVDNSHSC